LRLQHAVSVRSLDGALKTQTLTLARGEHQRLHFQSATASRAPVAASPEPRPASAQATERSSTRAPVPWLAWGITGALGISAGVTGVVALGAHADQQDLKARAGVTPEQLTGARDKVTNWALATDVLLAGTAVAAGVSLYLTLRAPDEAGHDTALSVGPSGLTLRQRF
jgi:hypothetical protein